MEYVCLNCWHIFESRKTGIRARICSNCRSRSTVDFNTLCLAVEGAKEWISANRNITLEAPFILIRDLPIIRKILMNTFFPRGIEAMRMILTIARAWEPEKLSVEDHVILYLRKL